jgi:hypothetical protein
MLQVDVLTWRSKIHRINQQIRDVCAILCGLVTAQDYKRGQALVQNRDFSTNEQFFQVGAQLLAREWASVLGSGEGGGIGLDKASPNQPQVTGQCQWL